jgi:hypothetical protein
MWRVRMSVPSTPCLYPMAQRQSPVKQDRNGAPSSHSRNFVSVMAFIDSARPGTKGGGESKALLEGLVLAHGPSLLRPVIRLGISGASRSDLDRGSVRDDQRGTRCPVQSTRRPISSGLPTGTKLSVYDENDVRGALWATTSLNVASPIAIAVHPRPTGCGAVDVRSVFAICGSAEMISNPVCG